MRLKLIRFGICAVRPDTSVRIRTFSAPAVVFRQRWLAAEDHLARVALQAAHRAVERAQRPLAVAREGLDLPAAGAAQAAETRRDAGGALVEVLRHGPERLAGVAHRDRRRPDLREGAGALLAGGGPQEALRAVEHRVDLVGR